jgi:trehalose 6-phosphate synthase
MARLMVASNRGPGLAEVGHPAAGGINPGGGGLVTGLARGLKGLRGVWVSSLADSGDGGRMRRTEAGHLPGSAVELQHLPLDAQDFAGYYDYISNELLAAMHLHLFDPVRQPRLGAALAHAWASYRRVNRAFAEYCGARLEYGGQVFIQDYHLSLTPALLRQLRPDAGIAHFTHSPWAHPSDFAKLPAALAAELLEGMLGADLICFYTPRWAGGFLQCCQDRLSYRVRWDVGTVHTPDGRTVAVRGYPLGVDGEELRREAASEQVQGCRRQLIRRVGDRRLVARVERMDPVKNLLRGLEAFELFLSRNPDAHGRVVHFALAYETRSRIPSYATYAAEVTGMAEAVNGRFRRGSWEPVILETRPDYALGLAAMSLADVLVVNTLRDGMNLVAKEGPLLSEHGGVLVLSVNAGAADHLGAAALLVNPFDTAELADAITAALAMPASERRDRAESLRQAALALPPREWFASQQADLATVRDGAAEGQPLAGLLPCPQLTPAC